MESAASRDLGHAYVVGEISGKPDGNRAEFVRAATLLREQGWHTHIPHDMPSAEVALAEAAQYGRKAVGMPAYRRVMRDLIRQLMDMDAVVALPGWSNSTGASFEVQVARMVGIPVYLINTNTGQLTPYG